MERDTIIPEAIAEPAVEVAETVTEPVTDIVEAVAGATTEAIETVSETMRIEGRLDAQDTELAEIKSGINGLVALINNTNSAAANVATEAVETTAEVAETVAEVPEETIETIVEGDVDPPFNRKRRLVGRKRRRG